jgi:predicted RNA-binding protein with PIN domain
LQDPHDEEKLVQLLLSYKARTGKKVIVVFDPGQSASLGQTRQIGGINVVFASPGSSADQVIARRVRNSRDPSAWLVVTSDVHLAREVAEQGARVQPAADFAGQLQRPTDEAPEQKPALPNSEEVEDWLALFERQGS